MPSSFTPYVVLLCHKKPFSAWQIPAEWFLHFWNNQINVVMIQSPLLRCFGEKIMIRTVNFGASHVWWWSHNIYGMPVVRNAVFGVNFLLTWIPSSPFPYVLWQVDNSEFLISFYHDFVINNSSTLPVMFWILMIKLELYFSS